MNSGLRHRANGLLIIFFLAIADAPSVKIWLTDWHKIAEKAINHTELTTQLTTPTLTDILTPLAISGPKTHAWTEGKKKEERCGISSPTASGWIAIYCRYVAGETREVTYTLQANLNPAITPDHVPIYLVLLYRDTPLWVIYCFRTTP